MKNLAVILFAVLVFVFPSCKNTGEHKMATELFPVSANGMFGFVDRTGKFVINPNYLEAGAFRDGLALVATASKDPKLGYIDKTGHYAINPDYIAATSFSEGIAFVTKENSSPTAINKTGKVLFTLEKYYSVNNFSDGLAAVSNIGVKGLNWGFVDTGGHEVIFPAYKSVGYYNHGLCPVQNEDEKWGYIDKDGRVKIEFQFDEAESFKSNSAIVGLAGKRGAIDLTGKYIINPIYEELEEDGQTFQALQVNKWGWVNDKGTVVINNLYDMAFPFNGNDLASVKNGNSFTYIDKKGKAKFTGEFNMALPFDGEVAIASDGEKYGLIDNTGKFINNNRFEHFSFDYLKELVREPSLYSSIFTDSPTPERIAYKWLTALYHYDFATAEKYSSPATLNVIQPMAGMSNMIPDSAKAAARNTSVTILPLLFDNSKNTAVVNFSASDHPEKIEQVHLVKEGGKWLVLFTKNDASSSGN